MHKECLLSVPWRGLNSNCKTTALLILIIFSRGVCALVPSKTTGSAAKHSLFDLGSESFSRQNYSEALSLWSEALKQQPDSSEVALKVCELKVLLESRPACRNFASDFLSTSGALMGDKARKNFEQRYHSIQSLFLTDEGQSVYLQALARVNRKEVEEALRLFNQAEHFEKGNLKVLKEKAKSELTLGLMDPYFETVRQTYEIDPFDSDAVEALVEIYFFRKQFEKIMQLYAKDPAQFGTIRNKTSYAVALAELDNVRAMPLLQSILSNSKVVKPPPIVWFQLGKGLAKKSDSERDAVNYLNRFLVMTDDAKDKALSTRKWDPFNVQDKRQEARNILSTLKHQKPTPKS